MEAMWRQWRRRPSVESSSVAVTCGGVAVRAIEGNQKPSEAISSHLTCGGVAVRAARVDEDGDAPRDGQEVDVTA